MATEPAYLLFPAVGALIFAVLGARIAQKSRAVGELAPDWGAAFGYAALAQAAVLVAGSLDWPAAAEWLVSFTAAAAGVSLVSAMVALHGHLAGSRLASPRLRWAANAAALGLAGLGWGGVLAVPAAMGDGEAALWAAAVPAGFAAAVAALCAALAVRLLAAAGPMNTLQLLMGAALVALGLVVGALGSILLGAAFAMGGAGFLQVGVIGVSGAAPGAGRRTVRPKVEPARAHEAPAAVGTKVRIPKGRANRVTSFRDGEPPGGDSR